PSVEEVVVGFGVNVLVAPAGRPDTLIVTAPVKPPVPSTFTVNDVDEPLTILRVAGVPLREKSGTVTFNVNVVLWVTDPAAVIVIVAGPDVADAPPASVTVVLHVGVHVVWLNDAVTPAGNPDAVQPTGSVGPSVQVAVTVLVTLAPCATDTSPGVLNAKSNGAGEWPSA